MPPIPSELWKFPISTEMASFGKTWGEPPWVTFPPSDNFNVFGHPVQISADQFLYNIAGVSHMIVNGQSITAVMEAFADDRNKLLVAKVRELEAKLQVRLMGGQFRTPADGLHSYSKDTGRKFR